jgi:tocopherol cyclase
MGEPNSMMRSNFFSNVMHPEIYHGGVLRPPFFEGWYFKVVDAAGGHRFAFIPGIFKGRSDEDSHAFVQVLDGVTGQVAYHRYPVADFQAEPDMFDLRVGPNRFQLDHINLEIDTSEQVVRGSLHFDTPVSWPVRLLSPGVMGWFAWVPRMECYHGVLGFDHAVQGQIGVDGRELDFTGGRGYIEKDWGQAFPRAWVWMQTNHFELPRTCLTASVAVIPWMGGGVPGVHRWVLARRLPAPLCYLCQKPNSRTGCG